MWILRGQGGGPRPKILFYAIFVEGKQSYQILFTRLKNIDPSRIYRIFTCDYLKILNFDTKNLSPPTVFELET